MRSTRHLPRYIRYLVLLAGFSFIITPTSAYTARVIYAAPRARGAQTGADWNNASDLQSALQSAEAGDAIWAEGGTYKPTTGLERTASFRLKSGVALYGGFVGTESALSQRDVDAHPTILSGDLLGNDSGDVSTANPARVDNSYHVVTASGTDSTALLDGFTIRGGNANGEPALLQNLGAGIYSLQGHAQLCHLIVENNSANFGGGGIAYDQGSLIVCHATIRGNLAGDSGGGIFTRQAERVVLARVAVVGNQAQIGGGVVPQAQQTVINLAFFAGNRANLVGGGLAVGGPTILTQSVFTGNHASSYGSAIASADANPLISQVTLANNISLSDGGAFALQNSDPVIRNSIFWDNSGGQIVAYTPGSQADIRDSLVQGGYFTGTHILDANPQFLDADGTDGTAGTLDDNVRLGAGSPAIDAGNNVFVPADLTDDDSDADNNETAPFDLDGGQRQLGGAVDLGAYERNPELRRAGYLPMIVSQTPPS